LNEQLIGHLSNLFSDLRQLSDQAWIVSRSQISRHTLRLSSFKLPNCSGRVGRHVYCPKLQKGIVRGEERNDLVSLCRGQRTTFVLSLAAWPRAEKFFEVFEELLLVTLGHNQSSDQRERRRARGRG